MVRNRYRRRGEIRRLEDGKNRKGTEKAEVKGVKVEKRRGEKSSRTGGEGE